MVENTPEVKAVTKDITDGKTVAHAEVRSGRRWSDWHVVQSNGRSIFFWLFGWLLDEKCKPSMSRMMLAFWTYAGWRCILHELTLKAPTAPLQNAVWTAWWAAEGVLALAVFGPSIASYFGAGAAGAVTGVGASIRDDLSKIKGYVDHKTGETP